MRNKSLVLGVIILMLLTGCSSKTSEKNDSVSSSIEMKTESSEGNNFGGSFDMDKGVSEEQGNTQEALIENNRKVIKRADLTLETDNFDSVISSVEEYINIVNGYIESSNAYQEGINSSKYKNNRTAEFIIRVPQENFEKVLNEYGLLGIVTNKRVYGEDVSSDYFDKESRLQVLKAQESKYLELLNKTETVTEAIEVEKVLTEVRYEIEYLTGYLNKLDSLTSLSTINLYINEVYETNEIISEPKTLGEKVISTFKYSVKGLGNLLSGILLLGIAAIPFLIIPVIIGVVVFVVYKYTKKNKEKIIKEKQKEE